MREGGRTSMKVWRIIGAIFVTLVASWVGLIIGDRLLAGTTGLAIVFAICSMGAFIIAFCGRDE